MEARLGKIKKCLVVLTNTSTLRRQETDSADPTSRTGFDVKSVAYIWDFLCDKNHIKLDICTPKGGPAPMDPKSLEMFHDDHVVKRFLENRSVVDQFKSTEKVDDIEPEEYCAILLVGDHGAMVDYPESHALATTIMKIYARGGYICTIGYGICGLLNARKAPESTLAKIVSSTIGTESGDYLIKGMRVTCPTLEEERKLKMEHELPFVVEEKLKERGAQIHNKSPFSPNVITDERLITAQNPQSAEQWVHEIAREWNLKY